MSDFTAIKNALNVTGWDAESYGFYFAMPYAGRELNGSFDADASQILALDPAHLREIAARLPKFDEQAHALIQQENPDEDAAELELSDIIIYANGAFSLGYDVGESEAGQIFLYAAFNADFSLGAELVYEAY